jgi:F-type H+-transporting ATPase subunit delta
VAVKERIDLIRIEQDLATFAEVFTTFPALEKVLMNPAVPTPRKRAAVVEISRSLHALPMVDKLLAFLAERDRLVLVPSVLAAYRDRLMDHQKVVRAEVTTASALDADRTAAIERSLERLTGRTVTLSARVDPAVIGGLVARVGGTVYDGSVATQLEKMRQRLVEQA